jgi:hypothetical protein
MEPILSNEFDISKVTYGAAKTLDNGAKHIRFLHKKNTLYIQTPEMMAVWGVNKWDNPNGGPAKFSLDLSFKDMDDNPELLEFKQLLDAIDAKLVDDAFTGALPTHTKKFSSRDVAEILYKPIVKTSKDDKFPPSFKISLPVGDKEEFTFPTYVLDPKTHQPKLIDLKSIPTKGALCKVIIMLSGVWVAGGSNFGLAIKGTQLLIQPPISRTDFAFKNIGAFKEPAEEEDIEEAHDEIDG